MKPSPLLALFAATAIAGCKAGPDAEKPATALPAHYAASAEATPAGDVTRMAWWEDFADPTLNLTVTRGLAQNLTVQQALERVEEASAARAVARSGGLPEIAASGSAGRAGENGSASTSPYNQASAASSLRGGWVFDLFGETRRSVEAADALLTAARADVKVARLTYLSSVVAAYAEARYYQEAIAVTRVSIASRRKTLAMTEALNRAGAATRLDIVQANALLQSAMAELPPLEAGFRNATHRIGTLTGEPATAMAGRFDAKAPQPLPKRVPSAGVPADLLRNRPDIRREEARLAAATARIGVAEAALYPSLRLEGSIGLSQIVTAAATGGLTTWSFGPSLSIPIFNGGSLRARVDIARSTARQEYLAWKQSVLEAVEDVESALVSLQKDREAEAALGKVIASFETSLDLARKGYDRSAVTVLSVLDIERSLGEARLDRAAARRRIAEDHIRLSVALGGGSAVGGSGS